jgi:hypothetical protein
MPKTVVGLFENPALLDEAVRAIEALGIPRKEVRTLQEPVAFDVTGVMSFPRLDFETDLNRELARIGATGPEALAYVEGLRHGGALALATGSDENIDDAARVMNLYGAVEIDRLDGEEPRMPVAPHLRSPAAHDSPVLAGRTRQPGGGACLFVW